MSSRRTPLIDLAALTPVEKIALADTLYDAAMREIEAASLSPGQLADLDRRIADVERGRGPTLAWTPAWREGGGSQADC